MSNIWYEWAYSNDQSVPAELISNNPQEIWTLVARDSDVRGGNSILRTADVVALNQLNVYPVVRDIGSGGTWFTADGQSESYQAQDGGNIYEIKTTYRPMTLIEAQDQGAIELRDWSREYIASYFQFSGNSNWYDLNKETQQQILRKAESNRVDVGQYTWDGVLTRISSYRTLFDEMDSEYTMVEDQLDATRAVIDNASTLRDVSDAIDALPAIPVPAATPGASGRRR